MRWCFALALVLTGCGTEIGDECSSDVECGNRRVCDRASRGGYCTVSPCTASSCPANSVCVEFENQQTYCMAVCDNGDDCRSGYQCDKETAAVPFCREAP